MNDQLWAVNAREDAQKPNLEPNSPKENEQLCVVSEQQLGENKWVYQILVINNCNKIEMK
jgi:hypothetical protein